MQNTARQAQPLSDMAQTAGLSAQLDQLIRSKPVTSQDIDAAALFTLDAIANMIAGCNSPPGRKLLSWARGLSADGNLSSMDQARQAFLLGGLCHILEMDDLHRASVVHPGCVVVPAAMVLGHGENGAGVLAAVLAGFEATCRVGMSVGPGHYRTWHNTATCGPFGSAVAAGRLLDLDAEQMENALGNAGSQSAGLWEFIETGAETKHLHAGRAAEAGVVAAQLALHGFTGAPTILEGKRGFFAATCPDPNVAQLLDEPDSAWQLHNTSIKPWPSCRHTHPAIACALQLRERLHEAGGKLADIRSIEINAYPAAIDLCDQPHPTTVYAAKFSLQHCAAAALSNGHVDFTSFEADVRDQLSDVRARASLTPAEPYVSQYPQHWGSAIKLDLVDGQSFDANVHDAKGDPEAALSRDELIGKCVGLLDFGGLTNAAELAQTILAMTDGGKAPDIVPMIEQIA